MTYLEWLNECAKELGLYEIDVIPLSKIPYFSMCFQLKASAAATVAGYRRQYGDVREILVDIGKHPDANPRR